MTYRTVKRLRAKIDNNIDLDTYEAMVVHSNPELFTSEQRSKVYEQHCNIDYTYGESELLLAESS